MYVLRIYELSTNEIYLCMYVCMYVYFECIINECNEMKELNVV